MNPKTNNEQMGAYSEAVKSGLYAKKTGLVGKYDNVRRYWEEEITRHFLYPSLLKLVERRQSLMRRIRILDLGCGSADGFEMLAGIRRRDANLQEFEIDLLTPDILGIYKGVDLNDDLIQQAREIYGDNPKMVFEQADFTQGLPLSNGEKAYDLYFTSYGTCSHHNEDETLVHLITDIAKRTEDYCIIICDWLGRYSYEWQSLWTNDLKENRNMDYVVSYIYEEEEREERRDELQHLFLRLMSRQEAESLVAAASKQAGVEIKPLVFFDRSTFTGRHMDTAEYNPHVQPIRQAVNSLHETNQRTDLSNLIINYVPKAGFEFINDYFEALQMCWNTLVQYVEDLLTSYDEVQQSFPADLLSIPASYPPALREMMERMRRVLEGVGWLGIGLPRENVIEPQLGYALRYLVRDMQQGQGCAHGLVGVFEVDKTSL
jgi:SAM-dependent methyltransferase